MSTVSVAVSKEKPPLYADHKKVYPRQVRGVFRRLKWIVLTVLLAIYYSLPWIRWDRGLDAPAQAVLLDVSGRRLYFFWIEIWPQEIYYLTGVLILAAVGLFLVTAVAGRLWCGYACPQTVWTDLFMLVERWVEGDRPARMQLDRTGFSLEKLKKKVLKHAIWLAISVITGGAWILYFVDAPTFMGQLWHASVSGPVLFFIGLFTTTTYLLAGYSREQVCTYMCPWPRFQSAMLDEDSLTVTYRDWRGEGRRPLRKSESWDERVATGGGDCIDCHQCVQVCPTGIDIRNGPQMECIGCGLCIDACNDMMSKIDRPGNLIAFDTERNHQARPLGLAPRYRAVRPRTLIYSLILIVIGAVMVTTLVFRPRLDISVLRDRAPLFVSLSGGEIRNGFTVKISNMTRQDRNFILTLPDLPQGEITVVGPDETPAKAVPLAARRDSVNTYRVYVRANISVLHGASTPLDFVLTEASGGETAHRDTVFLGPEH
ncbi:MAG: cytochrome c oxidase accessory protein CcoG [Azospirillaceae bacterium]|nr:cytochrome c oxidase accessory protein CcoG [Azospirillaceae bacterium]